MLAQPTSTLLRIGSNDSGIKSLPQEVRPREKILSKGPSSLTDCELLAILLRTGIVGKGVLQMASEILKHFGGLTGLLSTGALELKKIKGLGPAKRAELMAVLELARRSIMQDMEDRPVFTSPGIVREYVQMLLGNKSREVFAVLFLNAQNHLLASDEMFHGTLGEASVYPREIVQRCIQHQAAAVIFAHNHPSGSLQPSASDIELTHNLRKVLAMIGVNVLDHIIVTRNASLSMAESGLI